MMTDQIAASSPFDGSSPSPVTSPVAPAGMPSATPAPSRPDFKSSAPAGDIILVPDKANRPKKPLIIALISFFAVVLLAIILIITLKPTKASDMKTALDSYINLIASPSDEPDNEDADDDNDEVNSLYIASIITGSANLSSEELSKYLADTKSAAEDVLSASKTYNDDVVKAANNLVDLTNLVSSYATIDNITSDLTSVYSKDGLTTAIEKSKAYSEYSGKDATIYNIYENLSVYLSSYLQRLDYFKDKDCLENNEIKSACIEAASEDPAYFTVAKPYLISRDRFNASGDLLYETLSGCISRIYDSTIGENND